MTQEAYVSNLRWYKAAQVIQSIVGLVTIPLTTAVCSGALMVCLQRCTHGPTSTVTLRQMTVLADKGWTDVASYFRFIIRWTLYGSSFLIWAVLLHPIRGLIAPLQQIFLSSRTIKTPTLPVIVGQMLDIPDKFVEPTFGYAPDSVVSVTQNALTQ